MLEFRTKLSHRKFLVFNCNMIKLQFVSQIYAVSAWSKDLSSFCFFSQIFGEYLFAVPIHLMHISDNQLYLICLNNFSMPCSFFMWLSFSLNTTFFIASCVIKNVVMVTAVPTQISSRRFWCLVAHQFKYKYFFLFARKQTNSLLRSQSPFHIFELPRRKKIT